MTVADLVDRIVESHVLVFGALPPAGRDLDLLVPAEEEERLAVALGEHGFVRSGSRWARFRGCSVDVLELVPAGRWRLPRAQLGDLFAAAKPIEGLTHLVRPAPHHALLLLARRLVRGDGRLDAKRRRRLEDALAEDPDAWARAREQAPAWGLASGLALLESAQLTGAALSRSRRRAALAEQLRATGRAAATAELRSWGRVLLPRARRGGVIAFSGLDGAGKTSQASALQKMLTSVGMDASLEWTRLSYNPSLDLLARPVKRAVGVFARAAPRPSSTSAGAGAGPDDPGRDLRRRSAAVTHAWATVVALANALTQRRRTRPHLRAGRFVVCDRYTLDSAVHLRYRYGEARTFRVQAALVRLLSPKPVGSYFLAVPPEVALERKPEQYDLKQLARQARLYEEEYEALGWKRLDGRRPREELCEEIARDLWSKLV